MSVTPPRSKRPAGLRALNSCRHHFLTRTSALALLSRGLVLCSLVFLSRQSIAQGPTWTTVKLSDSISLRLPSYWQIQGQSANALQSSRANAVLDLTQLKQHQGSLLLQASGDSSSITISIIPGDVAGQPEVGPLSPQRIAAIDADFRADLEQVTQAEGATILSYAGTSKERLGSLWSLTTRYRYQIPGKPILAMESHRVFLGNRSIGVMFQCRDDVCSKVRPTLDQIRGSLTLPAK